ncbi:hypothetical protein JKP88DRAFT_242837 [Tribonema minus]|uniref:Uncharacterized protein n=1 Tax=Tribonema minus TaxID=303371 RepID=A0A835ZD95_9STRA|nr:hypothetical protein JKP88DRAFT_242837 [Tribonema minus]
MPWSAVMACALQAVPFVILLLPMFASGIPWYLCRPVRLPIVEASTDTPKAKRARRFSQRQRYAQHTAQKEYSAASARAKRPRQTKPNVIKKGRAAARRRLAAQLKVERAKREALLSNRLKSVYGCVGALTSTVVMALGAYVATTAVVEHLRTAVSAFVISLPYNTGVFDSVPGCQRRHNVIWLFLIASICVTEAAGTDAGESAGGSAAAEAISASMGAAASALAARAYKKRGTMTLRLAFDILGKDQKTSLGVPDHEEKLAAAEQRAVEVSALRSGGQVVSTQSADPDAGDSDDDEAARALQ